MSQITKGSRDARSGSCSPAGVRRWGPLALLSLVLATSSAARAAAVASSSPPDSVLHIEAHDGLRLSMRIYRFSARPTRGVILVSDWGQTGSSCWADLPDSLRDAGFEVLVPDLRGSATTLTHGPRGTAVSVPSRTEIALLRRDALVWPDAFSASVDTLGIACVGWGGLVVSDLVRQEPRIVAVAWVAPRAAVSGASWNLPAGGQCNLLLVASDDDLGGSAVAIDLFSRFNERSELRLVGNGEKGCVLTRRGWVRAGLFEWLRCHLGTEGSLELRRCGVGDAPGGSF